MVVRCQGEQTNKHSKKETWVERQTGAEGQAADKGLPKSLKTIEAESRIGNRQIPLPSLPPLVGLEVRAHLLDMGRLKPELECMR